MKKVVILFYFLCMLSLFSCESEELILPEFDLDVPDQLNSDEYEVYSLILEGFSQSQLIVRQQTTVITPQKENFDLFFKLKDLSNMESGLYSRYEEINSNPSFLDQKIIVPSKDTKLISNKEYGFYFEREDHDKSWEFFKSKYPDAAAWYFHFNRIGFNEDRTQAIVGQESYWYMESSDGPPLNGGRLYYLEKTNDSWEIKGSAFYPI